MVDENPEVQSRLLNQIDHILSALTKSPHYSSFFQIVEHNADLCLRQVETGVEILLRTRTALSPDYLDNLLFFAGHSHKLNLTHALGSCE